MISCIKNTYNNMVSSYTNNLTTYIYIFFLLGQPTQIFKQNKKKICFKNKTEVQKQIDRIQ